MASKTFERDITGIPPELVWDGSLSAFAAEGDDPYLAVSRLHDGPPVIWAADANVGHPGWVCTSYETISEVLLDHEHFSAERPGMIADLIGEPVRMCPVEFDPPAHHGYRRILNPFFTPKAVRSFDEPVRNVCGELISKFEDKGGCDFVADFAILFPSYIFLDLMGMPREKLPDFIHWEHEVMRAADPKDRVAAAREIYAYLSDHKDRQKANPSSDFLRAIVTGEVDGRPLDHLEIMGMLYVLYVGGLDTVYSTLGWVMRHLATHPELQDRLRDHPEDLPAALEEFFRAFSVAITFRQVTSDYMFHGAPLKKGDEIYLPIMLADRDPRVFDDPHTVDIDRKSRHINFGTGVHTCLGLHLAKREICVVLEEFLKRFRNIRIREGETYRYHTPSGFGVDYLPIVWDRA